MKSDQRKLMKGTEKILKDKIEKFSITGKGFNLQIGRHKTSIKRENKENPVGIRQ